MVKKDANSVSRVFEAAGTTLDGQKLEELVLENHLHTCVVEQVREGNEDVVDEAMDLIRKFGSR